MFVLNCFSEVGNIWSVLNTEFFRMSFWELNISRASPCLFLQATTLLCDWMLLDYREIKVLQIVYNS